MEFHDTEAEQAVLGSLIYRNDLVTEIKAKLNVSDFCQKEHRPIYEAMLSLSESGIPIDEVTIADYLIEKGSLNLAGGRPYLAELIDYVPSSGNAVYYAKIVKDLSVQRKSIQITEKKLQALRNGGTPSEVFEKANNLFEEIQPAETKVKTLRELQPAFLENLEKWSEDKNSLPGLRTGYKIIDENLNGLTAGSITIIGARPSVGKSALGMNIYTSIAKSGIGGLFVSLEMNEDENQIRFYSAEAKVDGLKMYRGNMCRDEWDKMAFAFEELGQSGILDRSHIIIDSSVTIEDLRVHVKSLVERNKIGFVVLDYLQLLHSKKKVFSREQEVAFLSRELKRLAMDFNIPIVVISQLNRDAEDKEPTMKNLRESGAIEQDANNILFIHKFLDENSGREEHKLILAKGRMGAKGAELIRYIPKYTLFKDHV